jgi:hypothetical protein
MPRASTSGAALQKIANALDSMRSEYSTKEYRRFDGKSYSSRFQISNTFSTVLKNMGAIQVNPEERGMYRLTEKMEGLRPTTVVKHINKYQKESREKVPTLLRRKRKAKATAIRVVQPELFNNEPTFDVIITALKEKIRKEVMAELLNSVSNS